MSLTSGDGATILRNQTDSVVSPMLPTTMGEQWIEDFFETESLQRSVQSLEELNNNHRKEEFDWFDHWYPLHVVDTMDPTRPHKAQLLGMNLVLWNDGPTDRKQKMIGNWNAYRDSCPHRRAPLSEGRVEEDGSLSCSYHGWKFEGGPASSSGTQAAGGQCCSLPYSPRRFEDRHMAKAACEVFATKIADGMLWVFPRSGLEGILRSENRPLPLVSELHDDSSSTEWQWRIPAGVRDFPCGFDTMIENTLDPAHFCVAHHGTLGNRYTDPSAFGFSVERPLTSKEGFELDGDMGSLEFVPPCLVKYRPNFPAMPFQKKLLLATYCVPTKPGWVRPLANVLVRKSKNNDEDEMPDTLAKRALDIFMGPFTPTWFGHIASSIVLHQDAGLLHHQYRNMKSMGYYNSTFKEGSTTEKDLIYQDLCYTPNRVDKGIVTFRRWFDTMAGGDVPWACDNPPESNNNMDNVDIYDMWDAHTKNCQYCSTAYANLEAIKKGAYAISLAALLFFPYESHERVAVTLVAGGLGFGLEKFNELFLRYEYHHHEND